MAKSPMPLPHEIHAIVFALQRELAKLDALGAGIAAIHVNAAIEQLRDNLAVANDAAGGGFDPDLLCLLPKQTEARRRVSIDPRD